MLASGCYASAEGGGGRGGTKKQGFLVLVWFGVFLQLSESTKQNLSITN
jgi:hypothetical protein